MEQLRSNPEIRAEKNEKQNQSRKFKISNITVKKSDYVSKCCVQVQVNLSLCIVVMKLCELKEI